MGVDVASFGDPFAEAAGAKALTYEDPFGGVYKKLVFDSEGTRLLGGVLVGDASDFGTLARPVQEREAARRSLPATSSRRAAAPRCGGDDRRPGLLVQQRQRAADPRGGAGPEAHDRRPGQDLHPGRHRLRRLPAARHRPAQGGAQGGRRPGRQPALRALPAQPPGTLPDRHDQGDQDVRRPDRRARHRARLRGLQAGRRLDPGEPLERERPRPGPRDAAGHQRPLPRQHPARRTVFGGPARSRRRDHAGEAHRPGRGRPQVRPLHQDHRGPAHRPLRGAGPPAARDLGRAGRGRLRERPRLRQGGADGQELRRLDLVPVRRAGLGRVRHPGRAALPRASGPRTSSRGPSRGASASAPRPRARTSA